MGSSIQVISYSRPSDYCIWIQAGQSYVFSVQHATDGSEASLVMRFYNFKLISPVGGEHGGSRL